MTFEEKIQAVIASMTTAPTFIGGDWWDANVMTEKAIVPAAVFINPISGEFDIAGNMVSDQQNCLIAFLDKVKFDTEQQKVYDCVNAMKLMALEFIDRANRSGYFYTIKKARYSVTYDRLDINVTGVILDIQLKERDGVNLCIFK